MENDMTDRTTIKVTLTSGTELVLGTDTGGSLLPEDFREYLSESYGTFIPLTLINGHEVYITTDKIERFESCPVPRQGGTTVGGKRYPGKYVDEE